MHVYKNFKVTIPLMAYRIVDNEANVKLLTVRHQPKISQGFSCTNYMYCLMKKIKSQ